MNDIVTTCIPVCLKKDETCSFAILLLKYDMPRCHEEEDLITNLYRHRNLHCHILFFKKTNGFTCYIFNHKIPMA